MPTGLDPPTPRLTQGVFDAIKSYGYDDAAKAFDNSGTHIFLWVEKNTGSVYYGCQWFYANNTDGGDNPKGHIPQETYDIISGGTWSATWEGVTYSGTTYRFRLQLNQNGKHDVVPIAVT